MTDGALVGRIATVRGTVLEVDTLGAVPPLGTALECRIAAERSVTAFVQAHAGGSRLRAVAVDPTRGLKRGAEVRSGGLPLTVPVGPGLLGRVVDLEGRPLDGGPPVEAAERRPLKRAPPAPGERRPWTEVYETGIKVIDLFCPFLRGGRAAVFGGAGVGKRRSSSPSSSTTPSSGSKASPCSRESASARARG